MIRKNFIICWVQKSTVKSWIVNLKTKNPIKIAMVEDMWLTGFDVPFLDSIYIDKPIQQHSLIQTISRVNRKFEGKNKGLVVDYIGIKKKMYLALKQYSEGDKDNFEDSTISGWKDYVLKNNNGVLTDQMKFIDLLGTENPGDFTLNLLVMIKPNSSNWMKLHVGCIVITWQCPLSHLPVKMAE